MSTLFSYTLLYRGGPHFRLSVETLRSRNTVVQGPQSAATRNILKLQEQSLCDLTQYLVVGIVPTSRPCLENRRRRHALRPARAPARWPRVRLAGRPRRRSGGGNWCHRRQARYWEIGRAHV